jgi:hypothetical protein
VQWAKNLVDVLHQQQGILELDEAGDQGGVPSFDVLLAKRWCGHQYVAKNRHLRWVFLPRKFDLQI